VKFSWSAYTCIEGASITIGGKSFTFPNVSSGVAVWNGTNGDKKIVKPKKYKALLMVSDDCCGANTKEFWITVMPPPKKCDLKRKLKSSVNLSTGSLLMSEQLFAAKGFAGTSVNLSYNSLDSNIGPLGANWSHNYEISLTDNGDGTTTLQEGDNISLYVLNNGIYVADTGDYSTLVRNADSGYTLTYKDGARKRFSAAGKITEITDLNGNATTFAYDATGKLATVTDSASRITTFTYDADNRLSTITDPAGKDYIFSYNGNLLSSVTWPDNSNWQYTYDANGFMQTKTDPLGKITTYTYDDQQRVLAGTDSAGAKTVAYPAGATTVNSTQVTDENGGVWTYTHDSHNGYMTQMTDPLGKVTTYEYDANRNRTKETAPDGSITRYTYDAAGNRLSMTDALGNTTTYSYNALGQVTSSTDPLGRTTTSSYNNKGQLTKTVDGIGRQTIYTYDTKGNLLSVTNPQNQTSSYTYDAAGNQVSATDFTGATTTFTYDGMGNMLTQTDALGKVTTFEYDGRYRLAKVTDPLGNATSYAYDVKGNKTSQTDANGNVTRFEYDDQGHLTKTIDPQDNSTTYSYGTSGCSSCGGGTNKLTSLTDAKGQTTSYQYDLAGHLTQETDPLSKNTIYGYDTVGNMVTRTDANNSTITYSYDALKRLTKKTYPDASTVNYNYDSVGRLTSASNADVTYSYAYDNADRVTSVTDSRGYTIAYRYDLLGNRTAMTLQPNTPDQRITTYGYDSAGRLTTIGSNAGVFTYGYDTLGRRTSIKYPNNITAAYVYDDASRLTSLTHSAPSATIASYSYTHDNVGNRTSKAATEFEQYLYDTVYRLLTVTAPKPETLSYDQVGNRNSGPGAKDSGYLYNAGNQMTRGRKLDYQYDDNGNQVTKTVPSATDKNWTQSWDFENRLSKMEKSKGTDKRTVSFNYDPTGRRIGKQISTIADGVTKTQTYAYVYDNDNIILEVFTDESSTITKTFYTHGAGVDEHLALERNSQNFYFHSDGLGSVTTITDINRNIVQSYSYDSFGMLTQKMSFANSYTYTGREWDKETGLYYYRARYYDPMEGRFISKDPAGNVDGPNQYSYVQNNPINMVDPTGMVGTSDNNDCCFVQCWRRCLDSNYGASFNTALGLSYIGITQIVQEIYNGVVQIAAAEKLKALSLEGAFTKGNITEKIAAANKAANVAKRLGPLSKALSVLSKSTGIISAGATGYVIGASGYCMGECL
jgi:RHS repeat-associated protein